MQPSKIPGRGKRRHILIAVIVLVALLLPAVPAKAVYNGILDTTEPDSPFGRYSNVGLVFTESTSKHNDVTGGGPPNVLGDHEFCNGVLIAPDLVLTAGFCVNDPWDDYAYFSPVPDFDPLYDYGTGGDDFGNIPDDAFYGGLGPWEEGDPVCDPDTCFRGKVIKASSSVVGGHALAVIDLDVDLTEEQGIQPAKLPAYNSLNNLVGQKVTIVGYGNVNCAGDDCPPDDEAFFDDDQEHFPIWDRFEHSVIQDEENEPPTWWRRINLTERRYAVMEVIPESGDWPKAGNRFLELRQTGDKYSCIDDGGPYFLGDNDPDGTLVAINFDQDCSPITDVLRLDTPNARNFLCNGKFPELSGQLLCGGSGATAQAARADDGGDQAIDRQHGQKGKHASNKGSKHRGKGKRGR